MTGGARQDPRPLVAAAARGDESAFGLLISTNHADLKRLAVIITRDEATAERATNEAWRMAWARLPLLKDGARVRPWLAGITVEAAGKVLDSVPSPPAPTAGGFAPGTPIGSLPLRIALEGLPPRDRTLLGLRYLVLLPVADVAFAVDAKEKAVERRLAGLMQGLRRAAARG